MFEIRLTETAEEREQVFKFRYRVYIEEMGKKQHYADHKQKKSKEPLDSSAHIFAAFQNGQIVGTARTNFSRNSNLEYYPQLYKMYEVVGDAHPQYTSISTKLIIQKELRGSLLFVELAQVLYKHLLLEGIKFDFSDCDSPVTVFFKKLGYQVVGKENHPEYGEGNIMMLDVINLEHLEKINSPFKEVCKNFFNTNKSYI